MVTNWFVYGFGGNLFSISGFGVSSPELGWNIGDEASSLFIFFWYILVMLCCVWLAVELHPTVSNVS